MEEYSPYRWHDDIVHELRLERGAPGEWRSELVLRIDHIVVWPGCDAPAGTQPQFAPAELRFHNAADLKIDIDCGDTAGQVMLYELSIDRIERQEILERKVHFDRPLYRWRIELNMPRGGSISLAATGFTMTLQQSTAAEAAALPDSAP